MSVQEPANANISCRNLDEQQHDAKNYCKIHEGQGANECYKGDDMMANHLLIVGGEAFGLYEDVDCVNHEVATGVD